MHSILSGRPENKSNFDLHVDIFQKIYEIQGKWNPYKILCGHCFNSMGVWVGK